MRLQHIAWHCIKGAVAVRGTMWQNRMQMSEHIEFSR